MNEKSFKDLLQEIKQTNDSLAKGTPLEEIPLRLTLTGMAVGLKLNLVSEKKDTDHEAVAILLLQALNAEKHKDCIDLLGFLSVVYKDLQVDLNKVLLAVEQITKNEEYYNYLKDRVKISMDAFKDNNPFMSKKK